MVVVLVAKSSVRTRMVNADDGALVVHAVKDSSPIAEKVQVGDKLVAVDDDDVRAMTAIKVSKLISRKSNNPSRKLTIIRHVSNH